MFSGIIESIQKPLNIVHEDGGTRVQIPVPKNWEIIEGESISIDGVCATVETIKNAAFTVFFMPETLHVTTLAEITPSHNFNLERCLRLNSLVGGHLVSGHVDTMGVVKNIANEKDGVVYTINLPKKFTKYVVYKGSITINGVSLTIVSVTEDEFTVSLIPYTLTHTNLGELKKGDKVNIEVDLIAKYLEKLVKV
jgi:riboflavin synthase